jgi:hypothetical protein
VTITRPRHPLQDRSLRVLGGMRRHGGMELLLELPDGSKRLIPAAWTDAEQVADEGGAGAATLGSLADLLRVCALIADLRGQAAGMSPCKEDSRAACPTQFDTRSDPTLADATTAGAGAHGRATARRGGRDGDYVAGQRDRQIRRSDDRKRGGQR